MIERPQNLLENHFPSESELCKAPTNQVLSLLLKVCIDFAAVGKPMGKQKYNGHSEKEILTSCLTSSMSSVNRRIVVGVVAEVNRMPFELIKSPFKSYRKGIPFSSFCVFLVYIFSHPSSCNRRSFDIH